MEKSKVTYIIKYNYREYLTGGVFGPLSEYKYISCWDMTYQEALQNLENLKKEMIYELSMGSKPDYCLEEFYILKPDEK